MCGVNDMDEKKVESIIFGLKETIAEQKAEIERLTEENGQLKGYNSGLEYQRLSELENKIEQGTLIELPCKVGDTVYQTDGVRIYESKVELLIYDCGRWAFNEKAIGTSVFLTREEAEKRLKELQNV